MVLICARASLVHLTSHFLPRVNWYFCLTQNIELLYLEFTAARLSRQERIGGSFSISPELKAADSEVGVDGLIRKDRRYYGQREQRFYIVMGWIVVYLTSV